MAIRPPQGMRENIGGNKRQVLMTVIAEAIVIIANNLGSIKVAIMIAKSIEVGGTHVRAPTRVPTPQTPFVNATLAHRREVGDILHDVTTVAAVG